MSVGLPPTDASIIRIISWNVNDIAPFLQTPITSFLHISKSSSSDSQNAKNYIFPASLRELLHRHNWPAMLFLQEVKIATGDVKTQDAVRVALNSKLLVEHSFEAGGPAYEAHFTLPNDLYNARGMRGNGRIYGVCSIFRSDLRESYDINVRTVDWDSEGRIAVIEITSTTTKMAIFNIYAVNGTDNPYRDSVTGAVRGTRHDRKLEIHRQLMRECMDLEHEGWDVLLVGDMNVALDARDGHPRLRTFPQQHILNRADFHEKLLERLDGKYEGFHGIDVWRKMHGEERKYTFFPRGRVWGTSCDRIDYFIAGTKAWDKGLINACGILDSEAERGPSDHVPIWADIRLECNGKVEVEL